MRWIVFAVLNLIVPTGPQPARTPLPEVPPGWSIELVVEAPKILFPTAIACAPDGTIFLGQDPMDMPGPPTRPIDSVVAIKDGKVRVFADKLWSVMGLEWIDDTLYVVHAPYLSAFTDTDGDGRADKRVDLITGLGPKIPGFSGINDHVASGVRLGMDGFLYISFGDKGIPDGVGKDGTRIRVEGGGVIRIRPDGTGLEVVSTGERNPLSVALTATDDIITYGNDDDSKTWPNSLTHHIVGGDYGYPYRFVKHPGRALPIVAGQLGGSGTQGVCYNEEGLPQDYRGDFFFCDWGLQEVIRYKLEKSGGTYRVVSKTPFIKRGGVSDFRPFSIAAAPDGTSFYIVDWAFSGWLADGPKTGRLYKMTYVGRDQIKSSVRPFMNNVSSLLGGLDHPSLPVRLQAQRKLAKIGTVEPVAEFFRNPRAPQTGRIHALWALDQMQSNKNRDLILSASRSGLVDEDSAIRLQAVRVVGIRKDSEAVTALVNLLKDADPAVRREAAIALGKIGGPVAVASLMTVLGDSDRFAEWSIEQAIRRLKAWDTTMLSAALLDPKRRDAALALTDEAWSVAVVDALIEAYGKTPEPAVRAKIVANLAGLHRRYPEWSGNWFGTNPLAGDFPKKTRAWSTEGMTRVVFGLTKSLDDPEAAVRRVAINGMIAVGPVAAGPFLARIELETDATNQAMLASALGRFHIPGAAPTLAKWVADETKALAVRAAALDALAGLPGRPAALARLNVIYDKKAPPELVARVLPSLGQSGVLPANDVIGFLESESPKVRVAAISALAMRTPVSPNAKAAILAHLVDKAVEVRKIAIEAAGTLRIREAIPNLLPLAEAAETRPEATQALSRMPDPRGLPIYLAALADRDPEVRKQGEIALLEIRDRVGGDLESGMRAGKFSGVSHEVIERVLTRFAPVINWNVIGPFPRTTAPLFLKDGTIDFAREHAGVAGVIKWTPRSGDAATGRVALDDFKAGAGDKGGFGYDTSGSPDLAAFAYAEIPADRDRVALLLLGSSGSLIVTLNGEQIVNVANVSGRPYAADSDRVRISLKKGTNRLLVRTRQGIGSWSFSVQVSDPAATVYATRPGSTTLADLRAYALGHEGDSRRGEAIFFDVKGVGCIKCHAAGGRGTANVGPDLTGLALKYDRTEVVRSVLEPSNRLATGYQPILIAKSDGRVVTGLLRGETEEYVDLIDADAKTTRVMKAEIDERRVGDVSLMPSGLVDTLSKEEFADLVAYLMSLRAAPPR